MRIKMRTRMEGGWVLSHWTVERGESGVGMEGTKGQQNPSKWFKDGGWTRLIASSTQD